MRQIERSLSFAALACTLVAASCSGGGGGSVGAAATPPAGFTTPAGPVPIQAANTTMGYVASSATATVSGGSFTGAATTQIFGGVATNSLTITTDANGVTVINFTIQSGNYGHTFSSLGSTSGPTTLANLSGMLGVFSNSDTTSFDLNFGDDLDFSGYGIWVVNAAPGARAGTFAIGNLTRFNAGPTSGTATYNGATEGIGSDSSGNKFVILGNAQLVADFGAHSVSASLTGMTTSNGSTTGSLPDLSGSATITSQQVDGHGYSGSLSGGGLAGTIVGNFYGTAAQETAGTWQASGSGKTLLGSFGAKQ